MEDYMRGCTRKLALWYTRTFKPIMTHDELEPIMATLGFVGLPADVVGRGDEGVRVLLSRRLAEQVGSPRGGAATETEAAVPENRRASYLYVPGVY
ncbi:hypothetical protein ACFXTN_032148 [Malus domestica]